MKAKFFTLLSLSVLTLIIFMGVISAADGDVTFNPTTLALTGEQGQTVETTFKLTSTTSTDLTDITDVTSDLTKDTFTISFSNLEITGLSTLTLEEGIESGDITLSITIPTSQETGEYTGTVEIWGILTSSSLIRGTLPITLTVLEAEPEEPNFCEYENPNGNLDVDIKDITVLEGFGDDDEYWYLFDEIEVEIEVENKGEDKISGIKIEWGVYELDTCTDTTNLDTCKWLIELDDESEFNLKEREDKTIIITFKLNDKMDIDIDELNEDYVIYVQATGEDKETDEDICQSIVSDYVEIIIDDEFVILDNIKFTETASCGTDVEFTADVWNIGDEDQEDVFVIIYNEELGIDQRVEIGDVDAYEDEEINILLNIPEDAEEKSYILSLMVFDEYGEIFENDFDEDKADFTRTIVIEGNCISEPKVEISADLESEAKAGKELIVRATIVNTGTETSTFEISLTDYINWASLGSIVPESITLDAGESEDVLITLNVNSDVSGNQNFEILVTEGTKVSSQQIAIMIEQSGFGGLGRITGGLISESNWPIWTIGAVNIILVFIIILVAVKMSRK